MPIVNVLDVVFKVVVTIDGECQEGVVEKRDSLSDRDTYFFCLFSITIDLTPSPAINPATILTKSKMKSVLSKYKQLPMSIKTNTAKKLKKYRWFLCLDD